MLTNRMTLGTILCGCAVAACCASAMRMDTTAEIEVQSQTDTSLSVQFTDADNNQQTINFTRDTTDDPWQGPHAAGGVFPGIVFGNASPQFATPTRLRAHGITPNEAVRTFDAGVADRTFDDVTVYQLYEQGEMAIALWREGSITEVWYVGELVDDVLELRDAQIDDRLRALCSRTTSIDDPSCPDAAPSPRISACIAAQNRPNATPQDACKYLEAVCLWCETWSHCCDEDLDELSKSACEAYAPNCIEDPEPEPSDNIIHANDLLNEVAGRLLTIIDAE